MVRNTEVLIIISELPKGKAVGIDRLSSESLLYSDNILSILLSCCFTGMLTHGFLPSSFMDTKIIPLVKNRCAVLSDINNYRPVAIANVLSKVFENILLNRCEEYLFTTDNQFGFKSGCSTVYIHYGNTLKFLSLREQPLMSLFWTLAKHSID